MGKCAKLVLGLVMVFAVMSCDSSDQSHKDSIEGRLIYSFRNESPELQQHVAEIVVDAKALKYQDALNKLALLSATRRLTREQKYAVDSIVKQLRYDMEEKIFSERGRQE